MAQAGKERNNEISREIADYAPNDRNLLTLIQKIIFALMREELVGRPVTDPRTAMSRPAC